MDKHLLNSNARPEFLGERGFTLIEVMTAMVISLTVLMANLYLFAFAQRNFTESRSLTDATNLNTSKLADFRTMTASQIAAQNPKNDSQTVNGVQFTRTWTVSNIDVDHDGTPDMSGDIVKIKLTVSWRVNGKDHQVIMTTMTTGKAA